MISSELRKHDRLEAYPTKKSHPRSENPDMRYHLRLTDRLLFLIDFLFGANSLPAPGRHLCRSRRAET
jgi:hypothetical protein